MKKRVSLSQYLKYYHKAILLYTATSDDPEFFSLAWLLPNLADLCLLSILGLECTACCASQLNITMCSNEQTLLEIELAGLNYACLILLWVVKAVYCQRCSGNKTIFSSTTMMIDELSGIVSTLTCTNNYLTHCHCTYHTASTYNDLPKYSKIGLKP